MQLLIPDLWHDSSTLAIHEIKKWQIQEILILMENKSKCVIFYNEYSEGVRVLWGFCISSSFSTMLWYSFPRGSLELECVGDHLTSLTIWSQVLFIEILRVSGWFYSLVRILTVVWAFMGHANCSLVLRPLGVMLRPML